VSADYVRVFEPFDVDDPECCPCCEDMVRVNGKAREANSTRVARRVDPEA
jgi:hypothetical protein